MSAMHTNSILVPLDGSQLAVEAVPYAEVLASKFAAPLVLAEAVQPNQRRLESAVHAVERSIAESQTRLESVKLDVTSHGNTAYVIAEIGEPADVLIEATRTRDIGMVVMATHGRSGPSRWAIGSVAEKLLRRTHLPTLLIPPLALATGDATRLQKRLIVPTDGSELSKRIFPIVKTLAHATGSPITLVQAIDATTYYTVDAYNAFADSVPPSRKLVEEIKEEAKGNLDTLVENWRKEGLDVDYVVREGFAEEVILKVVEELHGGWIAMASHGRSGLGGLVLGSVALSIVHKASVPVLIVSHPTADALNLGHRPKAA